ncbi:50S ribosomal protein L23, partial [Candidatus Margulisiibacteriota bacterium]
TSLVFKSSAFSILSSLNPDTNKIEITNYLEHKYKVNIIAVNTMNYKGKKRRRGRVEGISKKFKKAVVTLAKGSELKDYKDAF